MNFDHINTIPRDLPRRGPAKWSKSADRDCPCRRYWLEAYRERRARGESIRHPGEVGLQAYWADDGKRPMALWCYSADPIAARHPSGTHEDRQRAVNEWVRRLKANRRALP